MSDALLLVTHGTRSAAGAAECRELTDRVRELRPELRVEVGNLELAEPTISDAVARLSAGGDVRSVTAVPLLLFRARHAKQDIPQALRAEWERLPGVELRYGAPLGIRDELLDLAADRIAAAAPDWQPSETAVVLARAGSTDPDAWADIAETARRVESRHGYEIVEAAFAGVAEPSLDVALRRAVARGARRVAAVPYLLFEGHLRERIAGIVAAFDAERDDVSAVAAAHLGPATEVARLVLDRYDEAAASARLR